MTTPAQKRSTYIGPTNWAALQKKYHPDQLEHATKTVDEGGVKHRVWREDRSIHTFKHTKPESLRQIAAARLKTPAAPAKSAADSVNWGMPADKTVKQAAAAKLSSEKKATIWNPNIKDSKKVITVGSAMPAGYKLWTGGTASEDAARAAISKSSK